MTSGSGPSAATLSLLEKLAVDNGFDRERPREGEWLTFASTQSPLRIWLSAPGGALFAVAFSQGNVAASLEIGIMANSILPSAAVAARIVTSFPELHRLVRRAFQLSKTVPHELLPEQVSGDCLPALLAAVSGWAGGRRSAD